MDNIYSDAIKYREAEEAAKRLGFESVEALIQAYVTLNAWANRPASIKMAEQVGCNP